ncbi:MAG TPA: DUF5684 domain-containing protein [Ignavibacteriaceae bacterium]|jgi:hypothetical protein|nr:DUF5684 domain-containing protein [Ignavibacteriaceae bacterium]HOJ17083.1 DUF5684 domain-containing protein [Ignavibacteriaceae bacterium]HPO56545.1 DUF5684 domain-containing protein [Ignavibacteriaceae bacterium]
MFSIILSYLQEFEYGTSFEGAEEGIFAAMGIMLVVYLAVAIFMIITMWKIFAKANKPGWAAIIPIYNMIVLLEVVGRPLWWILLMLIPCVNIVIGVILCFDLAKSFGKDAAFGIGILLLGIIFLPIIAFSSNIQYVGPAAAPQTPQYPQPPYQQPPQG